MMKIYKKMLASIVAALLVCLMAWVCGFDFNARGATAGLVLYLSLSAFFMTWIWPKND